MTAAQSTRIQFLPQGEIAERIAAAFDPHAGEKIAAILYRNPANLSGPDGQGKPPHGVVLAIQLAVADYIARVTEGMPSQMARMLAYPIDLATPRIVRACVADEDRPLVDAVLAEIQAETEKD